MRYLYFISGGLNPECKKKKIENLKRNLTGKKVREVIYQVCFVRVKIRSKTGYNMSKRVPLSENILMLKRCL